MNQYNSPLQSLYNWEDKIPNKIYLQQPINGVYYCVTEKHDFNLLLINHLLKN